ncbi:dual specificity protein phosphatase 9 isoform X2 [Otolemur garnettii]|uniref:dual specificity protein phosphatase 9 isoform X2 n=1 Tax=Otolemur garnettii TaxID=30611 RepID=UPI000C7F2A6D|nr:dual specificity protein phosphatase 9 isoform X2 [Otolemur garnettii]
MALAAWLSPSSTPAQLPSLPPGSLLQRAAQPPQELLSLWVVILLSDTETRQVPPDAFASTRWLTGSPSPPCRPAPPRPSELQLHVRRQRLRRWKLSPAANKQPALGRRGARSSASTCELAPPPPGGRAWGLSAHGQRLAVAVAVAGTSTSGRPPPDRAPAPSARRAGSRAPMEGLGRSCLWLRRELSPPRPQLLLLDCRSRELYESARIGGALSVALPALLLRRLRSGSLSVRALLPGPPLQPPPPAPVLLYDQGGGRRRRGEAEAEEWEAESVLGTLLQKLREEGYLAYYLQGGFSRFQAECPHLCETSLNGRAGLSMAPVLSPVPVVGLGGLCLGSDCSDVESEADRDSMSCGLDSEGATPPPAGLLPSFPVQILPNLYLGSARDSANLESLAKLGIRYILNVTPNLPNLFEKNGDFHYKQIPISDHWSQNLSQFFPEAIAFIEASPLAQRCLRPGQEEEV